MPARASAANQAPLRDQLSVAEWSRSAVIVPHPPHWAWLSLRLLGAQPISGSPGRPYPAPTRVKRFIRQISARRKVRHAEWVKT